jgi:hypothetical protein
VVEADGGERVIDESVALGARQLLVLERQLDVAAHGEPGVEAPSVLLEDECHVRRRAGHALAVDLHVPLRRAQQPGDAFQQGRLAAAGRPDDADQLAGAHLEADVADRLNVAGRGLVDLLQMLDLQQRVRHVRPP